MRSSRSYFVVVVAFSGLAMLRCGSSGDAEGLLTDTGDAGSDGATSSSSSSSSSGGSSSGGATDAAPGGSGGTTDAGGPGGSTTSLACGNTACQIPGQVCCVDRMNGGVASYACVTGTSCATPDAGGGNQDPPTALACSSAANCAAGTVCCIEQVNNTVTSACKATCTGGNSAQLCDPKAANSGCPADAGALSACSSKDIGEWGLPSTFATCGGRGN